MQTGWRDRASEAAQAELDELLDAAMTRAQVHLGKRRGFHPFGVTVGVDGARSIVGAVPDGPASAEVLATLVAGLRHDRDGLRAVALAVDVRVPELGTDAVRVTLEHVEGVALEVLLPYRPRRFSRRVDYGELRASADEPRVWSD